MGESKDGIDPIVATRFIEFINFGKEELEQIREEWKVIPQIEDVYPEENVAVFRFNKFKVKSDSPTDMLGKCKLENEKLADKTMRDLKESINKKCRGYYFSLKSLTIKNTRK